MHDPLVVAFEIRRPWPTLHRPSKPPKRRWRIRWSAFWTIAGREVYWPPLVIVWHREPRGRDSLTICGRGPNGERAFNGRWKWHIHHWHIQIVPLQNLHRWLFERCENCGRRFPYGYAPVAHQWDQPRGRWWRITRRSYHHECSSLVTLRRFVEYDRDIIRNLVAEVRLRADESEADTVDRLTGHKAAMPFHLRYRLQSLMDYERDDEYQLLARGQRKEQ